jgi:BASS family bile acid:Na+ symporter
LGRCLLRSFRSLCSRGNSPIDFLSYLISGVTVDPAKITRSLFLLMLLPLAGGLALKAWYEAAATRLKPVLDWVCNASLVPLVLLLAAVNIDKILHVFGTRGILAGLLFITLGFAVGWVLGGPDIKTRRVLALGTGQRNVAAAFVIGNESFSDPEVVIMIIAVTIVGLLTLIPVCQMSAKQSGR